MNKAEQVLLSLGRSHLINKGFLSYQRLYHRLIIREGRKNPDLRFGELDTKVIDIIGEFNPELALEHELNKLNN